MTAMINMPNPRWRLRASVLMTLLCLLVSQSLGHQVESVDFLTDALLATRYGDGSENVDLHAFLNIFSTGSAASYKIKEYGVEYRPP